MADAASWQVRLQNIPDMIAWPVLHLLECLLDMLNMPDIFGHGGCCRGYYDRHRVRALLVIICE